MDLGLRGRTAVVTGGSGGIGKATAKALAAEGVDVALAARNPGRLESVADEIRSATGQRILAIPTDVTKPDQVDALMSRVVAEFGRIDILANCTGGSGFGDPLEIAPGVFAEAMEWKYLGQVYCARAAAPYMVRQGWGRIINVVGVAGRQVKLVRKPDTSEVIANHLPGGAANAALLLFTKGLGLHLAPRGVLVNAVSPGPVATERLVKLIQAAAEAKGVTYAEAERDFIADVPLGRPARPEEIADAILFLASERASFCAGAHLQVDGGSVNTV